MASGSFGPAVQELGRLFGPGTVAGLTDFELLERFVRRRDESAFEALVARHGPMVLGTCRRLLGSSHAAEDAFQATFLVLVRKAGSLRRRAPLGPWLFRVAYRVAVRARATAARRRARDLTGVEVAAMEPSPAESNADLRPILDAELDRLPEAFRAPIVLCHLEGLTHEQAAAQLGWPVGTVRSRLSRGRDRLRDRLVRRGLAPTVLATALTPEATSTVVPILLIRSTVQAATHLAAGAAPAAALALAKGALWSMTLSKLTLVTVTALAGSLLIGGTGVVFTRLNAAPPEGGSNPTAAPPPTSRPPQAEGSQPTKPQGEPSPPGGTTPSGGSQDPANSAKQQMQQMMQMMRGRGAPGGPGMMMRGSGMGGSMMATIGSQSHRAGPLRFDGFPAKGSMVLLETTQFIATTNPERDRVVVYDLNTGRGATYRVPKGVKFVPMTSGDILALSLEGESIPEVAVYRTQTNAWYIQPLREPVSGKLEPVLSPLVVLYGAGRFAYAFSSAGWGVLELPKDEDFSTRFSPSGEVIVEDPKRHILHIFSPRKSDWISIDTTAEPPKNQPIFRQ